MSVTNPSLFIGEVVLGATPNTNLTVDANGQLAAGITVFSSIQVSQAAAVTTTSATFSTIGALSVTPTPGTYIVMFSGQISTTSGVNGGAQTALYLNTTQVPGTLRTSNINVALLLGLIGTATFSEGASHIIYTVPISSGQTLSAQFASPNGVTVQAQNSTMVLLRIA